MFLTYVYKITAVAAFITLAVATGVVLSSQDETAYAGTLNVDLSADPAIGPAPLNNVDLTADVSGTETGDITYKFDCRNDGSFEKVITTSNTSHTASDLCDYPNSGDYSARIKVERGDLSFDGTVAITVQRSATLDVDLQANPDTGTAPLNNVDLTADVSGSASGPITYKFDCTNNGSFEKVVTTSSETHTATDLCDYSNAGDHTAKVRVERDGLVFTGKTGVHVTDPTLSVDLQANPDTGDTPLNDVDLTADVSGSASGDITYKFDCTNNGSFERTVTRSSETFTASNLCDYDSPGSYTARVRAERQGKSAEDTDSITVNERPTLHVQADTSPSSGHAPLNDVDVTANVSGTAEGSITYRFDCTNNGSFERTVTRSSETYTANNLCDYNNPGAFTVRVSVERDGLTVQGTVNVVVDTPADMAVDFSADPAFGQAPLNNVDLTAFVSGSASGDLTYRFDCTNDGSFERTVTTPSNSRTVNNLCDYSSTGTYTAKVEVERGGFTISGSTVVLVF